MVRRLLALAASGQFLLALPLAGLLDDPACLHHVAGASGGTAPTDSHGYETNGRDGHDAHHHGKAHHEEEPGPVHAGEAHQHDDDGCACPILCEGLASPPALSVPGGMPTAEEPRPEALRGTVHQEVLPGPTPYLLPFSRPPPDSFLFVR